MSENGATDNAIPLTILTGFLGAGKTTLLNRILNGDHGLRVAVLVNDFGAINIDAELVVGVEDDMISLANGCVCCQVRDDLIEAVDQLLERPEPVDYVLLEASGIADPGSIFVTFADPKYHERIRVDSITCVVDVDQIFNEDDPEPVAVLKLRQIGFADLLVLNKTDLATAEQVARVRGWIDGRLNRVRIVETSHCQVPLDILLGVGRFDPTRQGINFPDQSPTPVENSSHHAGQFSQWSFETSEPMSLESLRSLVRFRLPSGIYRCKGIIHCAENPGRRAILQVVGRRCEITFDRPWGSESPSTRIVAIGAPGAADCDALDQPFRECIAGQHSESAQSLPGVTTTRI